MFCINILLGIIDDPTAPGGGDCSGFYNVTDFNDVNETLSREWVNADLNFDNIGASFLTMLVIMTSNEWEKVTSDGFSVTSLGYEPIKNNSPWSNLFFGIFISINVIIMKV